MRRGMCRRMRLRGVGRWIRRMTRLGYNKGRELGVEECRGGAYEE